MKTQTEEKSTVKKSVPDIKVLVDQLAMIEKDLERMGARKLIKEADEIKKLLREHITGSGYKEDTSVFLVGSRYEVEFGPCMVERVVTEKGKLKKYLGGKVYDQLASFSLRDLEKHLSKSQIANVVQEYYGARRVASIEKFEQPLH